jgi:hypothetical protein
MNALIAAIEFRLAQAEVERLRVMETKTIHADDVAGRAELEGAGWVAIWAGDGVVCLLAPQRSEAAR